MKVINHCPYDRNGPEGTLDQGRVDLGRGFHGRFVRHIDLGMELHQSEATHQSTYCTSTASMPDARSPFLSGAISDNSLDSLPPYSLRLRLEGRSTKDYKGSTDYGWCCP